MQVNTSSSNEKVFDREAHLQSLISLRKFIIITGLVCFIIAAFAQTQFLTHNTVMSFQHKVFLYGMYTGLGVGLIALLLANYLIEKNRPKTQA